MSTSTSSPRRAAGRNSYGHITVRHQGGGNRQKYRVIDFKRDKRDAEAKVLRLEYDPNRSAFIALCEYADGERRYILAPVGLNVGDSVVASPAADIKPGNALPMANILPRQGRAACPQRRRRGPAHGQGKRHGHRASALR